MNKQQALERIQKAEKELAEAKAALEEVRQWEPVGGEYYIRPTGAIWQGGSENIYRQFGTEYPTEEQAEKARDAMRTHNRLLAYVGEHAPDYEPDWENGDERKGCVYYNYATGKYYVSSTGCAQTLGAVYMPVPVARELAARLNNGEVVL